MRLIRINITVLVAGFVLVGALVLTGSPASGQTTLTGNVTVGVDAHVGGTLSKGSGTFMIDHPLDPKNKLLYHSFVESPDVKNLYDGVETFNDEGRVEIMLPDYFLALNKDFRYLATSMGAPMPNLHIEKEIKEQSFWFGLVKRPVFTIAGGEPNGKVSWQVTGTRKDVFIVEHPIVTEVEKGPDELADIGECLFEPLCK